MEEEIELKKLIDFINRYKKLIFIFILLAIILTCFYNFFLFPKNYEITGSLLLGNFIRFDNQIIIENLDQQNLNYLLFYIPIKTAEQIINNDYFLKKIFDKLNIKEQYKMDFNKFKKLIKITNPSDTTILRISVSYNTPQFAFIVVKTMLDESIKYFSELNKLQSENYTQNKDSKLLNPIINVVEEPFIPDSPIKPKWLINIIIAIIVSFVLSIFVSLFIDVLKK
ncbi:MAG: Wzz/FepE/Etk N-terminal domain-containing protein [Caldisericia bacterium]